MKKNTKKIKKNKKMLFQVGIVIFLLFSLVMLLNAVAIFFNQIETSERYVSEESEYLGANIAKNMMSYKALAWYLDYIEENERKIFDEQRKDQDKDYSGLYALYDKYANEADISASDIEKLKKHEKNKIASSFYISLMESCISMQNVGQGMEFRISWKTDDGKEFVLFQGDRNSEVLNLRDIADDSQLMEYLGESLKKVEYEDHLDSLNYDNGEAHEYFFNGMKGERPENLSESDRRELTHDTALKHNVYVPVMADETMAAVVTAQKGWSWDEVLEMILSVGKVEFRNALYLLICGITVLLLINKISVRPLARVQKNVRRYTSDKNTGEMVESLNKVKSRNEIGRLADDVSEMAVELERYSGELVAVTAEKERIGAELDVASEIQVGILPKIFPGTPAFEDRSDFEIFASMHPAKEVGGDLYDFFLVDDDHLALVIGDVSGKGVPAALFMSITTTLIRHELHNADKSIPDVLYSVNNRLCESNENMMFVTIWVGILDLTTGELVCSNGGHDFPMIKGGDGSFELVKEEHEIPLGIMEETVFPESKHTLSPGDVIYLYTDGYPEAQDADSNQFEENRMLETLNKHPQSSPEELEAAMKEAVDAFVGDADQFDDMTMLCVKYLG